MSSAISYFVHKFASVHTQRSNKQLKALLQWEKRRGKKIKESLISQDLRKFPLPADTGSDALAVVNSQYVPLMGGGERVCATNHDREVPP